MLPLTIGTPEQFQELNRLLREANYTEAAICERVGIPSIFEFKGTFERRTRALEIHDCLDALIHLLMDGEALSECRLRTLAPPEAIAVMDSLGMLGRLEGEPEVRYYATAFLYPAAGLYVASDRATPPDPKNQGQLPRDVVYAAITGNTRRFLAAQPPLPCEDLLDLCSGTGIAAMVGAARYASHAWACDITERSVHFSEFNCRLNGLANVTCARGDLYEAVGDRTFDRIVAHPPYIPAEKQEWAFRDGGVDGEQILKRIVEGLPRHLRPEGRFYCVTLATDREGESFEQRIRRWLGESEAEFDVVLAAHHQEQVRREGNGKGKTPGNTALEKLVQELKVTGTYYGTVALRRHAGQRTPVTRRALKSPLAGWEAAEWLLQFESAAVGQGFENFLLEQRPRFSSRMKLLVTHSPGEEGLAPSEFALWAEYPFLFEGRCEQWIAIAVTWCDGSRTTADLYRELLEQQVVSPALTQAEFLNVLRLLIGNGVLEVEGARLPAATA